MKDIKSNSLEESHLGCFLSLSKKMEENRIRLTTLNTTSQMIFKIVSTFLIAIFVFFSIKMLTAQPAQVMLIMVIFSRLWPKLTGIQSTLEQLSSTIPSFTALVALKQECQQAKELHEPDYGKVEPTELKTGLHCHPVYFTYGQGGSEYALKNINVHITVNSMTAIVGKSGAGKSKLIDILMGLNQPDQGEVMIDEVPLNSNYLLSF